MACYRKGGCGPYEMIPCNECPASRPSYVKYHMQKKFIWPEDRVTEKQLAYIEELQEFSEYPLPPFTGETKQEAKEYIDKYWKLAHEKIYNPHEDAGDRI